MTARPSSDLSSVPDLERRTTGVLSMFVVLVGGVPAPMTCCPARTPEEPDMTSIRREISIECSPGEVFAVLTDIERLAEFSHMTVGIANGPGRPLAVGDHFDQIVKVLHVELDTEWEVTELVADEKIRVEGRSKSNGSATITQRVAAKGIGSLVSFDIEYDPPFGILGDIADKALFERKHEEDAEQILAGLKALCEGTPRG